MKFSHMYMLCGPIVLSYATTFRNSKNSKIPSFFGGHFHSLLKALGLPSNNCYTFYGLDLILSNLTELQCRWVTRVFSEKCRFPSSKKMLKYQKRMQNDINTISNGRFWVGKKQHQQENVESSHTV